MVSYIERKGEGRERERERKIISRDIQFGIRTVLEFTPLACITVIFMRTVTINSRGSWSRHGRDRI